MTSGQDDMTTNGWEAVKNERNKVKLYDLVPSVVNKTYYTPCIVLVEETTVTADKPHAN